MVQTLMLDFCVNLFLIGIGGLDETKALFCYFFTMLQKSTLVKSVVRPIRYNERGFMMLIDKVGGINYSPAPREASSTRKKEQLGVADDHLDISKEASRKAELSRVVAAVNASEDPERIEKLRVIREKIENNEYDKLNKDQLDTISKSLVQTFFG